MENPRINTIFLGILGVIGIGAVLKLTGTIFLPLVIALLLAIVFTPFVDSLKKVRIPRFVGILLVFLLMLWICYLIGLFLFSSIQSFIRQFPRYQSRFDVLYQDILSRIQSDEGKTSPLLMGIDWAGMISNALLSWSGDFMSFMSTVGIILIFLVFMLLEKPFLAIKLDKAFRSPTAERIDRISLHIIHQIGRYLTIKLIISLLTGVLVWIAYTIIGLDFAILWGSLAFLFNFIPNIGSIIIGIITVLFSLLQYYPSLNEPLMVGLVMLFIQNGLGNFLEPKLQGDSLNLSPVIILFSLLLWGWLWGVAGMFLAVPLTVTIKIVCENIPALFPVSIIMGTGQEHLLWDRTRKVSAKKNSNRRERPGEPLRDDPPA